MAHSGSKGSHYALTAIGLGMLVLGIIMAVWNLVPGFGLSEKLHSVGNSSKADPGVGSVYKSKTFSVAYVLVASGTLLLLFSICLTIRDKRAQNQNEVLTRIQREPSVDQQQQEDSQEEDEETLSRYYVPSYEEVMNTEYGQQREPEENARISMSLPSYESLTGIDENTPTRPAAVSEARPDLERQSSQHAPRLSKRRKPLKIRRIKSEKLHLKNLQIDVPGGSNSGHVTIEPLTPPPKYDEVPKKATDIQGES